jgi:hypothetical protein
MAAVTPLLAQPSPRANPSVVRKPVQSQSPASITFDNKNGEETIEITNAAFEMTSTGIPGRPNDERLVLRTVTHTKKAVDDIGEEASTTVEAWPLGVDLKQKPLYAVNVAGVDFRTVDSELFVISRGLEDVEWWSVYKLGSGEHLFDTYVPLVHFSIARDIQTLRYVGLEAPAGDASDKRLRDPRVVAVLTYASAERVIREVLITSDEARQAAVLRSFADATRTLTLVEREPARSLRLAISQNYPSAPATVTITIPIVGDDLDTAHAQAPVHVHVAAWRR